MKGMYLFTLPRYYFQLTSLMTIYFCCCQFPYVFDIVLLIVIYVLQVHIFSLYDISFLTEPCTSANSLIT